MGTPKPLLEYRGETFLDRLIGLFSRHCAPVVVVLGANAETVRGGVRSAASFVVNPDYAAGQLSSMLCGLRAIPPGASAVLFTLADHPAVRPETVALLAASCASVAQPRFLGRRGHPVRFGRQVIDELLALPPDSTARDVVHRHRAETEYIDVDDPGILDDVDDPESYRKLLAAERA